MDGVAQPPEYHPEGDVLTHVALVLDHCPPGRLALSWSAVLHDVGKPRKTYREAEDRIRFDGHDVLSAEMADEILRRLCPKGPARTGRRHLPSAHPLRRPPQMRPARAERWMRTPGFRDHLEFHRADCMGSHQQLEIYEHALARFEQRRPNPPR